MSVLCEGMAEADAGMEVLCGGMLSGCCDVLLPLMLCTTGA